MAPGGFFSLSLPQMKPQISTQASVPRPLCSHLPSLNSISVRECLGQVEITEKWWPELSFPLGLEQEQWARNPSLLPHSLSPLHTTAMPLPLLFLSYNIEPAKQSVQQMAAEASLTSVKLLFQTSPPHCGSWRVEKRSSQPASHNDKKFSWKIGGMSKHPCQTGPAHPNSRKGFSDTILCCRMAAREVCPDV